MNKYNVADQSRASVVPSESGRPEMFLDPTSFTASYRSHTHEKQMLDVYAVADQAIICRVYAWLKLYERHQMWSIARHVFTYRGGSRWPL